jgi:hypothetical protein
VRRHGWTFEPHVDLLRSFGGDRFAAGVSLGYAYYGLDGTNADSSLFDHGYSGWSLSPFVMASLGSRAFVTLTAGAVFVDISRTRYDASNTALRVGGGLSAVVIRNYGADLALRLEGTDLTTGGSDPVADYSAFGVTLDAAVTFMSNL